MTRKYKSKQMNRAKDARFKARKHTFKGEFDALKIKNLKV
jgi:hypothetical protein